MNTEQPGRSCVVIETLIRAQKTSPERYARLYGAIARWRDHYKRTQDDAQQLCTALLERSAQTTGLEMRWGGEIDRPARRGELDPSDGVDLNALPVPMTIDKDTAAMLYLARKWTLKQWLAGVVPRAYSNACWSDLSERERDAARKMTKRFTTQHWAFREGRPPYPHTDLVVQLIEKIEVASGCQFKFSRNESDHPGGPMMELLVTALDCQLFASGAPARELLAKIIKTWR